MKKLLEKIVHFMYSAYVIVSFFLSMIISIVVYLLLLVLPRMRRLKLIYKYNRIWLDVWGIFSGLRMELQNESYLDPKQNYVFVGNHNSMLDILIAGSRIQHPFYSLAKKELLRFPMLGILLSMICIPVDRSSRSSRENSYKRMLDTLEAGFSILVFPEGTRNRSTNPLKKFHDGAFKLAIDAQVPIAPFVLLHVKYLQPVDTWLVKPGKIVQCYLPPISTKGLGPADIDSLKDKVYRRIEAVLKEEDKLFVANPKG